MDIDIVLGESCVTHQVALPVQAGTPPRGDHPAQEEARPPPRGDHSAAQALLAARVKREFARLMAAGGLSPNEAAVLALKAAS